MLCHKGVSGGMSIAMRRSCARRWATSTRRWINSVCAGGSSPCGMLNSVCGGVSVQSEEKMMNMREPGAPREGGEAVRLTRRLQRKCGYAHSTAAAAHVYHILNCRASFALCVYVAVGADNNDSDSRGGIYKTRAKWRSVARIQQWWWIHEEAGACCNARGRAGVYATREGDAWGRLVGYLGVCMIVTAMCTMRF